MRRRIVFFIAAVLAASFASSCSTPYEREDPRKYPSSIAVVKPYEGVILVDGIALGDDDYASGIWERASARRTSVEMLIEYREKDGGMVFAGFEVDTIANYDQSYRYESKVGAAAIRVFASKCRLEVSIALQPR